MLCKTGGQRGKRETVKALFAQAGFPYETMGVVFRAADEKNLYLAGDTIWCDEAKLAIDRFSPDVIIINACGAMLLNGERIIMDTNDVKTVCAYAPSALIIASHMDNVSHLTATRHDLKKLNLPNLAVPEDNEILDV